MEEGIKVETLEAIEKIGSLDIFSLVSDLPKYFFNLYKTTTDKKAAEVNMLMSTAVSLAANVNYHSFKVYCPKEPKDFYKEIERILFDLNIKDITVIAVENKLEKFIDKFKDSKIIDIKTLNGTGCSADIEQFYSEFERNLRRILNEKAYENDTNYKKLLMELEKLSANNTSDIKEEVLIIKDILKEVLDKFQQNIDDVHDSSKVIVISMGDYNKSDYEFDLDLRDYFDNRLIKDNNDWNNIKNKIYTFSKELKAKAHVNIPYELYLSTHMSISYCLGVCLNGKGNYEIKVMQKTQSNCLDWSIDSNISNEEFKDKLFNIESHILNEENEDVAVCISTMANSIYEDTYEFIKANNIPIKRIIDFNLGDRGSNRSVESGTHGWHLANQVRNEISRRSFKERKGNLHIFMAVPISIPFFLGQLSFNFKNIFLYEHTTKPNEKDLYAKSIVIEDADAIS